MNTVSVIRILFSATIGLFCVFCTSVYANDQLDRELERDVKLYDKPPSVEEIGNRLFPRRTRGIVIGGHTPDVKPVEKSVGLPVLFHFGKTTIVSSSKPYLDTIGQLMQQDDYARETLIIEGHTDAVGSVNSNQTLSELRALAVKDYLVQQFNINPLRLFPAGKGESQLYDIENPRANTNRRVEFLRYTGANG